MVLERLREFFSSRTNIGGRPAEKAVAVGATPGEALGESIDLIVGRPGNESNSATNSSSHRRAGEDGPILRDQIGLGNQSSALVGVGLIGRDVDGLLAQTLNETKADGGIFDQKSGRTIPPLE